MHNVDYDDIFPYEEYRKDQEKVIKGINAALGSKNHSLLIAPNGTGKTICNLAASLPLVVEKDLKLVYICRTHSQSARVIEEVKKINAQTNWDFKAVSLRGRKEMCIHRTVQKIKGSPTDSMNICSDLRKNKNCRYFNNLMKLKRETGFSSTIGEACIDAQELIKLCEIKQLCPYFLARFLMQEVQVIVCNYQWVFNPNIRDNFLAGAKLELDHTLIIIDECHNLSDFLAEMDSSRLTMYALNQARKELTGVKAHIDYIRLIDAWISLIERLESKVGNEELKLPPTVVLKRLANDIRVASIDELNDAIIDLKEYGEGLLHEKISAGLNPIDFVGNVVQFMEKLVAIEKLNSYFFCITPKTRKTGDISYQLEIVALDPRNISKPIFNECYATCSCSGTLIAENYSKILGLEELDRKTNVIEVTSPFPKNHIKAILVNDLNTKYNNRNDETFRKINDVIADVIFNTPKNIGIFCASYGILRSLLKNGLLDPIRFSSKEAFIEDSNNSASDNAELIRHFKNASKKHGGVLVGVSGGRNSEGEDFPGDFMNAVVVVGLPFHRPTPRTDAKIKYYDKKFGPRSGWNIAYLGPAIKRANQAAGRPIRKLEDKGAIILIDDRFNRYRSLMSKWIMQDLIVVQNNTKRITEQLEAFF